MIGIKGLQLFSPHYIAVSVHKTSFFFLFTIWQKEHFGVSEPKQKKTSKIELLIMRRGNN